MLLALKSGPQIVAKVGNPAGLLCRRIWYSVGKSGVFGITEYRQGRPLILYPFKLISNCIEKCGSSDPTESGSSVPDTILIMLSQSTVEPCGRCIKTIYWRQYNLHANNTDGQFRGDGRTVRTLVFGVYKICCITGSYLWVIQKDITL